MHGSIRYKSTSKPSPTKSTLRNQNYEGWLSPGKKGRVGGEGVRGGYRCEMFPWGVLRPAEKRGRPTPVYEVLFSDTGSLTGQYVTRLSLREPSDIRLYLLSCIILYWSRRCRSVCGIARVFTPTRRIILTIRGNSKLYSIVQKEIWSTSLVSLSVEMSVSIINGSVRSRDCSSDEIKGRTLQIEETRKYRFTMD